MPEMNTPSVPSLGLSPAGMMPPVMERASTTESVDEELPAEAPALERLVKGELPDEDRRYLVRVTSADGTGKVSSPHLVWRQSEVRPHHTTVGRPYVNLGDVLAATVQCRPEKPAVEVVVAVGLRGELLGAVYRKVPCGHDAPEEPNAP